MSRQPVVSHSTGLSLIGRNRELQALIASLERTTGGAAEIVLVEARAGVGKTRLLREVLLHAAERRFAVLHVECEPEQSHTPFAAAATALGALASSSDAPRRRLAAAFSGRLQSADPDQRFRAADAAVSFLEGLLQRSPVLFVLDDFQNADSGTRLVLRRAAAALADRRLMILLARRPGGIAHIDTDVGIAARLELRPLDRASVAGLAAEIVKCRPGPRLLRELDACGGNPLLVIELVRQLDWEGLLATTNGVAELSASSSGAGVVLGRRVDSLPATVAQLLALASVLGQTFSVGELAALSGRSTGDLLGPLSEAESAGLIVERAHNLAFSHSLLHEVTYDRIPALVRVELHREAAHMLAGRGASAGRIARHLAEVTGREDVHAVDWLQSAGREVLSRAPEEAADLFSRALAAIPPESPRVGDLLADFAEALSSCGRLEESVEAAERALGLGLGRQREVAVRAHLARSLRWQGRAGQAYAQAMGAASDDRELLAEAALAAVMSHRVEEGRALALDVLQKDEGQLADCVALSAYCFGSFLSCHWSDAVSAGARAVALGEAAPEVMTIVQPRLYYGHVLTVCCRYAEAEQQLQSGLREAEREGRRWQEPLYHQYLARKRWLTGDWDDAEAEDEAAVAAAEDIARWSSRLMAGPAQAISIRLHRGVLSDTAAVLREFGASSMEGSPTGGTLTDWQLGLVLEAEGRPAAALDILIPLWRRSLEGGLVVELRQAGPDLMRIALAADRRDAAEFALPVMEEIRRRAQHPLADAAWLHTLALWDASLDPCVQAASLLEPLGRPLELANTYESAARLAKVAGAGDEAAAYGVRAEELYQGLGAAMDLGRIRSFLRALGRRPAGRGARPRSRSGWGSLTESELRVARLVPEGLSNPEIAEKLFISRRTVETHLKHVYAKLELTSRVQLAAELARRS
ncbi:MAG TPA: BREX system ATP-binding domain-containing protein [Candidatus Dormibacteraeota bacterium]